MAHRPTLLLLHGFPLDRTLWDGQVQALSGVAKVIAPDLRGFGNDQRPVPDVLTMEALAADIKDLLDDRGIERAVLCGLSMGGYVALAFLHLWPERVAGLVLANTRGNRDDIHGRAARQRMAEDVHSKGMAVIARGMVPNLLSEAFRKERPDEVARIEAMIATQAPHTAAAAALGMRIRPGRLDVLAEVDFPVLVITGDQDALMGLDSSMALSAAAPQSTLHIIPGAGHLSNVEQPEAFNAAIIGYLKELQDPPPDREP